MKQVTLVNPFCCRMWALHDRLENHITEESCKLEIESFLRHGQIVPVLGRPLHNDPTHDVELIFGARRLFVARHLNKPLAVELRELSDRQALIAMDIENRQRIDISPYERGVSYARWLRSGYFESHDDIARALNVSRSQVSRLLKLAKLPSVVVNAFDSAVDICERWGLDLMEIWEDPQRKHAMAEKARAIAAAPRPAPRDIYRQLLATLVHGRKIPKRARDEVVTYRTGEPLFRIRHQSRSIALLLPIESVSAEMLNEIRQELTDILYRANARKFDARSKKKAAESPVATQLRIDP